VTTDAGRAAATGRVAGKVALITGAARGQGRSHAVQLASEGADIIGVDICSDVAGIPYPLASPDDLDETARLAEEAGARVVTAQVDVRDPDALALAVSRGVDRLSRLDIAVANAGVCTIQRWDEVDPAVWSLFLNSLPINVMEPEDVSDAVLYLASDESRYVTGLTMTVDAGTTAR